MEVSIVVPTYHEPALGPWIDALRAQTGAAEIIVVDDSDEAPRVDARVIAGPRRGKGAAVRAGFLAAHGEVIVVIDADLDRPTMKRIAEFVDLARAGNDVVIGQRSRWRFDNPLRFVLSLGLFVAQRFLALRRGRFFDTQCGLKAFRRDAAQRMAALQTVDGGMFDIEYLAIALDNGLRMASISVAPWPETRPSRLRMLECLRHDPVDVWRVMWNRVRGRYSK